VQLAPDDADGGVGIDASLEENTNTTNTLRFVFQDPLNETSEVTFEVLRVDTQPNQTISPPQTVTGDLGRIVPTFIVPANSSARFVINLEYLRNGEFRQEQLRLGTIGQLSLPIGSQVLSLVSWLGIVGLGGLVVLRDPRIGAFTIVVLASAFSLLGFVSVPAPALGIAGAIALLGIVSRGVGQ
jgi:hypothetical protein